MSKQYRVMEFDTEINDFVCRGEYNDELQALEHFNALPDLHTRAIVSDEVIITLRDAKRTL